MSRWLSRSHSPAGDCLHLFVFKPDSCLQVESGSNTTTSCAWDRPAPLPVPLLQMSFKMPSSTPSPEEGPLPWGGKSEQERERSLQEVRSKAGEVSPSSHLLSCPLSPPLPPNIHNKPVGYLPVSHHDTLDGLHVSGPVAEESTLGKGKSGQGKQRGETGKSGCQPLCCSERQVAGRKEVEEGTLLDDHPPVPPPIPPQQQLCGRGR